jgi:hypothetical protein
MKIEENTVCYTSEMGHNNFWYPTADKAMIKQGCDVQRLSWIGGGDKFAIRILKSCLVPISLTENAMKNTSPPTKNDFTIVWIEK